MNKIISNGVNIEERKKLDMRSGDTIRVTQKIIEKDKKTGKPKTRLQVFEGLCLAVKHGKQAGGSITIRKVASGVGVERIFPIYSPMVEKFEVVKRSKVRQSKLYHIREKATKEIRRQMRNIQDLPDNEFVEEVANEELDANTQIDSNSAEATLDETNDENGEGEKTEEVSQTEEVVENTEEEKVEDKS
jgi:large subunit ribosomal protein L19